MQTTIYLGSDAIQILQGDVRGGKLTISKHLTVEMGPGAMINGVITNEDMLLDAIDQADEAGDIDFHNTNLVINSSLIVNKNVAVPKMTPKELTELSHHEFEDATNFENLIIDYSGIRGKQGTNMLCCAVEREVLESYIRLFETAGIKLRRIDTALNATINYVEATNEYDGQTFAINMLDGNNLMYALFENGVYTFSSQARIMAERGTEAFTIEMASKLSSLVQFNKSQKSEYVLDKAYYAGLTRDEIRRLQAYVDDTEVSVHAVENTGNIQENFNIDDDFLLSDYFYPASLFFEKKNDVNLLTSYKTALKPQRSFSIKNKWAIPPLVVVAVMVIGFTFFTIMNYNVDRALKKANKYINDPTNVSEYSEAQQLDSALKIIQSQTSILDTNRKAMESYPVVNSDKAYQVLNLGNNITVGALSYDWTTGGVSITASAPNEFAAAAYVSELNRSGLFSSIEYQGYSLSEGSTSTVTNGSSTSALPNGQTVTTPNTETVKTPDSYGFSVVAYLKPGVVQQ